MKLLLLNGLHLCLFTGKEFVPHWYDDFFLIERPKLFSGPGGLGYLTLEGRVADLFAKIYAPRESYPGRLILPLSFTLSIVEGIPGEIPKGDVISEYRDCVVEEKVEFDDVIPHYAKFLIRFSSSYETEVGTCNP